VAADRIDVPLGALRVFDAAARHESFLKAAEELSLTPGAVSHQIRALEHRLGVRLFDRFNRAVRLTEHGAVLAAGVAEAFARLRDALERVRPRRDGPLIVSTSNSVAAKWLVPRLHRFTDANPDVEVLVSASDRAVDLARDGVDIAIRYGAGRYPGLHAELLARADVFPVCSPALLQAHPLRTPADLAHVVLLHNQGWSPGEARLDWPAWLEAAGAPEVAGKPGPSFSHTFLSMAAAIDGRGVTLASVIHAGDDLAAGRLVRPFDAVLENAFAHWVLCLPERADEPRLRRFRRWLNAEARAGEASAARTPPTPVQVN
jgi:LysR family glycine cleavage system transcriptional activator